MQVPISLTLFAIALFCGITFEKATALRQTWAGDQASRAANSAYSAGKCQCGRKQSYSRHIVGGSDAKLGEFPWYVSLKIGKHTICGGTIISPNWVMTAAHCTNKVKKAEQVKVHYGGIRSLKFYDTNRKTIIADQLIQHENYSKKTFANDLALIYVKTPFQFGKVVGPACLPWNFSNKKFVGVNVTASGLGSTLAVAPDESKTVLPDTLQKVILRISDSEYCDSIYSPKYPISESRICAYGAPRKDTCSGDSGGSIDYKDPATKRSYVIGVTSLGYGCAQEGIPGVYTRVTSYLDWIQAKTGETFCKY